MKQNFQDGGKVGQSIWSVGGFNRRKQKGIGASYLCLLSAEFALLLLQLSLLPVSLNQEPKPISPLRPAVRHMTLAVCKAALLKQQRNRKPETARPEPTPSGSPDSMLVSECPQSLCLRRCRIKTGRSFSLRSHCATP